jgi:hypothetical protein
LHLVKLFESWKEAGAVLLQLNNNISLSPLFCKILLHFLLGFLFTGDGGGGGGGAGCSHDSGLCNGIIT